jgi:hypothetical protein
MARLYFSVSSFGAFWRPAFSSCLFTLISTTATSRASEKNHSLTGINSKHLDLLKTHCASCHNEKKSKGKFRIDKLSLTIQTTADAERWQKVLNALNAGEMPPEDEEQVPPLQKADLVDDLGLAMVTLRKKMSDRHGEIAMSRLNRREYRNTLRELLGVEINVSQLPADHGLSNYDTSGASLYISSNQIESYLELGREAVEEAIDRYLARGVTVSHRHEGEELTKKYRAHFKKWDASTKWRGELAKAGSQTVNQKIYGSLKKKHPTRQDKHLPFYLHFKAISGAPPVPSDDAFRFFDNPTRVDQFISASAPNHSYLKRYLNLPKIEQGAFITIPTIHPNQLPTGYIEYHLPPGWPPGKYKVRFRAARADNAPEDRRFLEFGLRVRNVDLLSAHEVTGTMEDPQIIETSLEITRKHSLGENRDERQLYLREKGMHHQFHYPRRVFAETKKRNGYGPEYVFWIDWLEVERVTTEDAPLPEGMEAVVQLLNSEKLVEERSEEGLFIHQTDGIKAQRIRIINPDAGDNDFLHLREVQVMSEGKNIALEGTASQSSTHGNEDERGAKSAIDGDMRTLNHTSNMAESGEWWEVDFGREVAIDEIRIYNRNDSPTTESRLKNYTLEILDAKGAPQGRNDPRTAELAACFKEFSTQAFRGEQADQSFIDRLLNYYQNKRKVDGLTHREALTSTLAIVLSSPMFLYKSETSLQDQQIINQQELAQRLSYFLWSAPADATLTKLATAGKLSDSKVLRQQTDRLLDDPRSTAMIHGLVHQWLDMERLDFFNVNLIKHQTYDNSVKMAVRDEVYETSSFLLEENRSMTELLSADYVVINNLLAQFYGIPGVEGDHFRKVPLPKNSPRGGLLGMAAIHLMGGNGDESSPVERGAWVLRKLLHQPPPPAPANVPNLARLSDKVLTTRDRLRAHQELPQCASCHRKIDPIGFGLENFDAVGLWRTENSYETSSKDQEKKTWKIDPSGQIHKGPTFSDYFDLRDHIASQKDAFATSFTSAVIEYGMGRPIGFSDQTLINEIVKLSKDKNYTFRSFFHALIQHEQFKRK